MRALLLCLLALVSGGCTISDRFPAESEPETTASPVKKKPIKPHTRSSFSSVRIYTNAYELTGTLFRELGDVTGESCQVSNQDSPPNISTARKRLQINAAKIKANAVLLHRCDVTSGTPGCYRQAVCLGSALDISVR
ncbi:Rcs stress response system protein RcsF [Enterobacteriaceae bacterium ESL0689]|nr:Rcs stress response system protein RcsF [Enterobacteriaceae bacterium ESL0689]